MHQSSWLGSVVLAAMVVPCAFHGAAGQMEAHRATAEEAAFPGEHSDRWIDRMLLRIRGTAVLPRAKLHSPIAESARISSAYVPELDVSFAVTERWAIEAMLGATRHDVRLTGVPLLGAVDLGSVRILPPGLVLQLHFRPHDRFRPYAGAGVSYTVFFHTQLPEEGPFTRLEYDNAFGYVPQVGFDVVLGGGSWSLNVDGKRVSLDTDARLDHLPVAVTLRTWLLSVGAGYRFGPRMPRGHINETVPAARRPDGRGTVGPVEEAS